MIKINLPEPVKRYFWSAFSAVGVICFWAGIWDGIGELPILKNPFVSLIVGFAILFASGTVFKEFDPLEEAEKAVHKVVHQVTNHPQKKEFHIKYHDKVSRKNLTFRADDIKKIEKDFLVMLDKTGKEIFVPVHRITEVLHKGKSYWKV